VDWWVKKFDSSGNEDTTDWNLRFDFAPSPSDVFVNNLGDVYLAGSVFKLVSDTTGYDWWIKKIPN
jgi:hypothetical protein